MTKRNIPTRGNSLSKGPQWERALLHLKNCRPGGHHGKWCEMKSQSGQAESRKACRELRVNTHGGHGNGNDKVKLFFRKSSYKSRMLMRKLRCSVDPHERS